MKAPKRGSTAALLPPDDPPAAVAGPPPSPDEGTWTDRRVAEEAGIPIAAVEKLRRGALENGADVYAPPGQPPTYTPAGLKKIRTLVAAAMAAQPELGQPPAPRPKPVPGEDLTITRVMRWSTCVLANRANGLEVSVKVRNVRHLKAGMVLHGCLQDPMGWVYQGRLPRSLGEEQHFFPERKTS